MKLNKSTGNMYEWVTHTWGVGRGCSHQCEYCYVKMPRFHREQPAEFALDECFPQLGEGRVIFVGHTTDLFADGVHAEEIKAILLHCAKFRNTYVFQTKNPERLVDYAEYMATLGLDVILGTTIETNRQELLERFSRAPMAESRSMGMAALGGRKFITVEPIMQFDLAEMVRLIVAAQPEWINIGADSKRHHLPEPTQDEVFALVSALQHRGIEVRKKFNLDRLV